MRTVVEREGLRTSLDHLYFTNDEAFQSEVGTSAHKLWMAPFVACPDELSDSALEARIRRAGRLWLRNMDFSERLSLVVCAVATGQSFIFQRSVAPGQASIEVGPIGFALRPDDIEPISLFGGKVRCYELRYLLGDIASASELSRRARLLHNAIATAYAETNTRFPNVAACNIAVRRAFEILGDEMAVADLAGLANQQAASLEISAGWSQVSVKEALGMVTEGIPVVGAWFNPNGYGHSVLLLPGVTETACSVMSCGEPGTAARSACVSWEAVYASVQGGPTWFARIRPSGEEA